MFKIKDSELAAAAEKGMDEFLQVFIDAYLKEIDKCLALLNT